MVGIDQFLFFIHLNCTIGFDGCAYVEKKFFVLHCYT